MAGLDPAIHEPEGVDPRVKPGGDELRSGSGSNGLEGAYSDSPALLCSRSHISSGGVSNTTPGSART